MEGVFRNATREAGAKETDGQGGELRQAGRGHAAVRGIWSLAPALGTPESTQRVPTVPASKQRAPVRQGPERCAHRGRPAGNPVQGRAAHQRAGWFCER